MDCYWLLSLWVYSSVYQESRDEIMEIDEIREKIDIAAKERRWFFGTLSELFEEIK